MKLSKYLYPMKMMLNQILGENLWINISKISQISTAMTVGVKLIKTVIITIINCELGYPKIIVFFSAKGHMTCLA